MLAFGARTVELMEEYRLRVGDLQAIRRRLARLHDERKALLRKDHRDQTLTRVVLGCVVAAVAGAVALLIAIVSPAIVSSWFGLGGLVLFGISVLSVVLIGGTLMLHDFWLNLRDRYLRKLKLRVRYERVEVPAVHDIARRPHIAIIKCLEDNRELSRPERSSITAGVVVTALGIILSAGFKLIDHVVLLSAVGILLRNAYFIFMSAAVPVTLIWAFRFTWDRELRSDTRVLELAEAIAAGRERLSRLRRSRILEPDDEDLDQLDDDDDDDAKRPRVSLVH